MSRGNSGTIESLKSSKLRRGHAYRLGFDKDSGEEAGVIKSAKGNFSQWGRHTKQLDLRPRAAGLIDMKVGASKLIQRSRFDHN